MNNPLYAFLILVPALIHGQGEVLDSDRMQFASALAISPEMISETTYSLNWTDIVSGLQWMANSRSNAVVATETTSIARPNMRHAMEVASQGIDNGEMAIVFMEEYDSSASAYDQFLSDFIDNSMPVDLTAQHAELFDCIGDICIVEYPSSEFHDPSAARLLRAISGNLLISAFGIGETNLLSAVESVFSRLSPPCELNPE